MDEKQKLQLADMIKANDVEDQTLFIRQLKHSQLIRADVNRLIELKAHHEGDANKFFEVAMAECSFLFTYYTEIFNKLRKDEIDVNILNKFLDVLRRIEDGELDQHEGAFAVGTLLKEMYVDSALKKAEKLDEEHAKSSEQETKPKPPPTKPVSYKKFKKMGIYYQKSL